ncbi:MAG TPA: hypothetical protein VFN51_03660 [Candidatus Saccharimonadales bacterium]|nr:hypothetical protein [Candidatus Saccharimonadales bacterium]
MAILFQFKILLLQNEEEYMLYEMDSQKEKQIITVLDENKKQGITFNVTKQQLLKDGYSEADIVYAIYSDPYDADPDAPRKPHLLDDLYKADPEKAQAVAQEILQTQRQDDFDETLADTAAGALGPDIQSKNYYDVLAADRLGIPYFSIMIGGVVLMLIAIKLGWSANVDHYLQVGYGIVVSFIFVFKLIQEKRQINKK